MGGGRHFHYPKHVWSPSGGWWCNPVNWKMNTAIAAMTIGFACFGVFQISAERERRPIPPTRHIMSQKWCKHAKEDDPSLP